MTVRELIDKLQKMPPNAEVLFDNDELVDEIDVCECSTDGVVVTLSPRLPS